MLIIWIVRYPILDWSLSPWKRLFLDDSRSPSAPSATHTPQNTTVQTKKSCRATLHAHPPSFRFPLFIFTLWRSSQKLGRSIRYPATICTVGPLPSTPKIPLVIWVETAPDGGHWDGYEDFRPASLTPWHPRLQAIMLYSSHPRPGSAGSRLSHSGSGRRAERRQVSMHKIPSSCDPVRPGDNVPRSLDHEDGAIDRACALASSDGTVTDGMLSSDKRRRRLPYTSDKSDKRTGR